MALLTNKLQELIPLFPSSNHRKLEAVYQQIPGNLLKFIDPVQFTKKVECREQNLQVDSSMFVADRDHSVQVSSAPRIPVRNDFSRKMEHDDNMNDYSATSTFQPVGQYISSQVPNKYRQPLKMFLLDSIHKKFLAQNITEVSAKPIAEDIVKNCLAQSPDWGRYRCKEPSMIVQFDSRYIKESTTRSMNIHVHVYAFLEFQYKESRLPFKYAEGPRISFDVTIELNGIAIDSKKITEISELLNSSHNLEDVIEKIERTSKVSWENLNNRSEEQISSTSQSPKSKLSWDNL